MTRSMVVSSLLLAMYAFGLAEDCNPTPPTGNPPPQTDPAAGQPQQNPTQPDPSTSAGQNAAGTDPGTAIGGALQLPPWASVFDSGSLPDPTGNDTRVPWASEYWPVYEDSINYRWDQDRTGVGGPAVGGTLTDSVTSGSFFAPTPSAGAGPAPASLAVVKDNKTFWWNRLETRALHSRADIIIHKTKEVVPPPKPPPCPVSTAHGNVNGGHHVTVPIDTVPDGGYVGTGGAGPCIGVIVWDGKYIYVFHFLAGSDNIKGTLKDVLSGLGAGAKAVVFGNDDSVPSNDALNDAVDALNGNPNISGGAGFVNSESVYVQVGAGGSVSVVAVPPPPPPK